MTNLDIASEAVGEAMQFTGDDKRVIRALMRAVASLTAHIVEEQAKDMKMAAEMDEFGRMLVRKP